MTKYSVTGMSCAACVARIEKAVGKVAGVTSCTVSLLTNVMSVEGGSEKAVIKAVAKAGYGAQVIGENGNGGQPKTEEKEPASAELKTLLTRFISSAVLLVVLMYVSMGVMMWDFPFPAFFHHNAAAMGLLELVLSTAILFLNRKFFISGFRAVVHRAPNMDTLVALGAGAAYLYSLVILFLSTGAHEMEAQMRYMDEFYFEAAATILTLVTLGKTLETYSKGKTTSALKGLMKLTPPTATVLRNGVETTLPVGEVGVGEVFLVRPGEQIPVDGEVIEGAGGVNEAALTGESMPAEKSVGSTVSAGTVNLNGFLKCRSTRVGEDTTLSQIIKMVSDAASTKAPVARIADKVSGVFVPCVLAIALVTFIVWLAVGQTVGYAMARGVSVLVISCPCALGLATPVAIMVGNGVGARQGILFKTSAALESAGRVRVVVVDKTGTVTAGEPTVTDLSPAAGVTEEELVRYACLLERKSEHPLSRAVLAYGNARGLETDEEVADFEALPGNGLVATLHGAPICGGNLKFIKTQVAVDADTEREAERYATAGKTPLYFALGGRLLGVIAVADTVRADSPAAIARLKGMGIKVVMLTGDNERTARAVAAAAGIDEVIAGVLPAEKEGVIRRLQREGKVAMVGDGINDAPALTRADLGIAIGAGTDVAIDAADVVLVRSRLSDVPAALELGRKTLTNVYENLFWAFIYNVIGIPLAAGVWVPLFGWEMNPMYGAAAMSLSSVTVVLNALRLNLVRIDGNGLFDRIKGKIKTGAEGANKEASMKQAEPTTVTLWVEGMMCAHCEAAVKAALESVRGVASAIADHNSGTATVTLNKEISIEKLKQVVEKKGYKVLD